jgi:hypothetical protein
MRTRPDRLHAAALTLLLGYALVFGLLRFARSPRLLAKSAAGSVAASPHPPKPSRGLNRERLCVGACLAVAGLLTAAWGAFLVYLGAKLTGAVF